MSRNPIRTFISEVFDRLHRMGLLAGPGDEKTDQRAADLANAPTGAVQIVGFMSEARALSGTKPRRAIGAATFLET